MKPTLFAFCIACLSVFALVSCEFTDSGSGGTHVKNPTVEEMAAMEKQWGVQPRTERTRPLLPASTGDSPISAPTAPPRNPVPEPAPLPQTPEVVPPVFEPPPGATPDQIQKLRN